ncbi:hypothetical protein M426DRAFT_64600 [Hypoxylon sp. CI-4A]|nr:hypothetical protein M426DRAFT_64600 [Hypoxylon sp. CI-4A]
MASAYSGFKLLEEAIDSTPLIDNHAHPLLKAEAAAQHPLLSISSEANGDALKDSKTTLAHLQTVRQLAEVLGCEPTWGAVEAGVEKKRRRSRKDWTRRCLEGIETILIDDGLDQPDQAEAHSWHSQFTKSPCKRIVRIETVAADILAQNFMHLTSFSDEDVQEYFRQLWEGITKFLYDPEVVGFKSIVCYRKGLDIPAQASVDVDDAKFLLTSIVQSKLKPDTEAFGANLVQRLEQSSVNWAIVHTAAKAIESAHGPKKPLQFHTGLGDNDITLTKSSPSHLQTFIRMYPNVPIVLLHAGYPWTRETAYLAAMYPNVYADIGEVFPCISRQGQENVVKQMLEVCPWSKILCSTDAHGFPEMYLTSSAQIRSVLKTVLGELVQSGQLKELQAVELVQSILFNNSKKLYGLQTKTTLPTFTQLDTVSRTKPSDQVIIHILQNLNAKYLRIYWHDYTSSAKCRLIPIKQVYKTLSSGKPLTMSIAKVAWGILQNDSMIPQINATGMYTVHPDWTSLRPGPVDGHVSCFGDFTEVDGSEEILCPRTLLRRTVEKAATEQGLTFLFGFEVEFIVLERNTDESSPEKYKPLRSDGHAWSMARALNDWGRSGSFNTAVDEILDSLEEAGINVEQFHPESATGQYELVLAPLPPLEACDNVLHARQILESVAARHGFRVTLHPKPFAGACGSASHAHMSITSPGGDDPATYEAFYAGVLAHLRSVIAFTYSSPASYERMVDSFWAGGRWITWGTQNKEAPLRKVDRSHWELKVLDGLANPYFALAALLTAGSEGVKTGAELTWSDFAGDPAKITDAERRELGIEKMFPADLKEALDALEKDPLGLPPKFVQRYIDVKNAEMALLEPLMPEERRRWVLERY